MRRPLIVQHSFGSPGSGGPIGALKRLRDSPLSSKYEFLDLHQEKPLGGVSPTLIAGWAKRLRQWAPDMIHVRGLGNEGFHAATAAKAAGVEHILVSIHGTQRDLSKTTGVKASLRKEGVVRIAEPLTLAAATHVATVCQYAAKRDFVLKHGEKFVGVVPNGVPIPRISAEDRTTARRALGIPPESVSVTYVGRMSLEKGLSDFAHSLTERLPDGVECHVILAGEGPARQRISDILSTTDDVVVHNLGRVSDISHPLAATDIFVLPSLHENLSNALLEAMAAGVPVVATAVGGNVEVLTGEAGLLVPPNSPADLREAIWALASNRELRARIAERGNRRVRESYSLEVMSNGWDEVYSRILSEGCL